MVLITGGTGLLGSHLIYNLIQAGENVRVIIRNQLSKEKLFGILESVYENFSQLSGKINFVIGDITNLYSLHEALQGIKYVYHCAAVVSFGDNSKHEMLETNIRGTANVVNACLAHKVEKLVHVSSIAAIGSSKDKNHDVQEKSGWPEGKSLDYAYSKTESEFEVWRGISEGLNAVIVNPGVILGEGDINSGSGLLFKRVLNGMKYYTKGVTGFVDVKDVARLMVLLMKSNYSSERFILNAENMSYKDFFTHVAEAFQVKAPAHYASRFLTEMAWRLEKIRARLIFRQPVLTKKAARSAHHIKRYSSGKITESTGFAFTPVKDTIIRVAKFYRKGLNV